MSEHINRHLAKIGIFGIGLAAYWPQFEGLKETLESYQAEVERKLQNMGVDVVSAGLVDTALRNGGITGAADLAAPTALSP